MKAEANKLLASWVEDLEDFVSLFDLSSDEVAEDALCSVLAERPELLNDFDLSTGEEPSGLHLRQAH